MKLNTKKTKGEKQKCICLEDNKMTQALCPVHNSTEKPMDKWEIKFRERTDFWDNDAVEFEIQYIKDLLKKQEANNFEGAVKKYAIPIVEEAIAEYKQKLLKRLVKELEPKLHEFAYQVKGKEIGFKEARLARKLCDEVEAVIREKGI